MICSVLSKAGVLNRGSKAVLQRVWQLFGLKQEKIECIKQNCNIKLTQTKVEDVLLSCHHWNALSKNNFFTRYISNDYFSGFAAYIWLIKTITFHIYKRKLSILFECFFCYSSVLLWEDWVCCSLCFWFPILLVEPRTPREEQRWKVPLTLRTSSTSGRSKSHCKDPLYIKCSFRSNRHVLITIFTAFFF